MATGFPLLTTKKVLWRSVVYELLWFLRGDTNIKFLKDNGVNIWDYWANELGDLGPIYGEQWRHWRGTVANPETDQIAELIDGIRKDPMSRRHIVSAWNPGEIPYMALPPCHAFFQCYVSRSGHSVRGHTADRLSLHLYIRSSDAFLGLPFNIASYALLLLLLSEATGKVPHELVISFGDLHIYNNHREQVLTQLGRKPGRLPLVRLSDAGLIAAQRDLRFVEPDHILLDGYNSQPFIKGEVSV